MISSYTYINRAFCTRPDTGLATEGATRARHSPGYFFIVINGAPKGASPRTASAQAQ